MPKGKRKLLCTDLDAEKLDRLRELGHEKRPDLERDGYKLKKEFYDFLLDIGIMYFEKLETPGDKK